MGTSISVVILVAMLVIWMMTVSLPGLVAVTGVVVFTVPLPVSSIIVAKVTLVGRVVRFSVVSVGAWS